MSTISKKFKSLEKSFGEAEERLFVEKSEDNVPLQKYCKKIFLYHNADLNKEFFKYKKMAPREFFNILNSKKDYNSLTLENVYQIIIDNFPQFEFEIINT